MDVGRLIGIDALENTDLRRQRGTDVTPTKKRPEGRFFIRAVDGPVASGDALALGDARQPDQAGTEQPDGRRDGHGGHFEGEPCAGDGLIPAVLVAVEKNILRIEHMRIQPPELGDVVEADQAASGERQLGIASRVIAITLFGQGEPRKSERKDIATALSE